MLHLAGRIALGVDVADLLELERTLQGNRVVDATAQKDHILSALKAVGQGSAALVVVCHQGLQLLGQLAQLGHQRLELLAAAARANATLPLAHSPLRKCQGQPIESQQLAKEGLGGRNPHLNAGANIKDVVHHPGQGALGPVGDAQQPRPVGRIGHQPATLLLHRQGRQGVGGFPRLGHADRERVGAQRRRRITKFTGIKNACGDTGQLLQQIGAHLGGVAAGAAGQDLDPLHTLKHLSRQR